MSQATNPVAASDTSAPAAVDRLPALVDPGPASEAAVALARRLGLTFTAADVLSRRGDDQSQLERWLDPKLSHLTPPDAMADLAVASDRIARALRNRERIAVFGDYDCDGITSTAIVTEVCRALGGEVVPLIANRFQGGYGLSQQALARVQASGASLLITCDVGSSDHERIAAALKLGIDTVVIDHHLVPDEPLPALAFLNPQRPDCGFPYKGLASCGLALFVAAALRKRMSVDLDVRRWLDLVAVGTIADVAPLTGDNRALVRAGLRYLNNGHRLGLRALAMMGSSGKQRPMSAEDIAYQVAPRINAPGRLGDASLALAVLLEQDAPKAWMLAERVEQVTKQRRTLQRRIIGEALAQVASSGADNAAGLVLASPNWHAGVVGIVAGRLSDKLGKPTIIIAMDGDRGRGSGRAPAGFRLYDAIFACKDKLVGFGGHQAAAGVDVAATQVDAFRDAFAAACTQQLNGAAPAPKGRQAEVRLDRRDELMAVLADLERLEPCGQKNPAPRLLIHGAKVTRTRDIKGHLKVDLTFEGQPLSGFGPELGGYAQRVLGRTLSLVARLKRDHYNGGESAELLIEAIGPLDGG